MNVPRRNWRPLPSGVYTTELLPPKNRTTTVTIDRNTTPLRQDPAPLREDVYNELIHQLGVLHTTMARLNYDKVHPGLELAVEYLKSMRDAEA